MTDIIGDIHGHADKLEALLTKLGYEKKNGVYKHPERKVLFVGDYIDRGPKIRETLQIVRAMVDNEQAIALMGNHEYNAICFHFQETEGGHLRKHLIKNIIQHYKTLKQFQNRQEEYEDYIDWFKTLPVFYESESLRAVHACWDNEHIQLLKEKLGGNLLNDELIYESVKHGTAFKNAILDTLKGKELALPENFEFKDKDGNIRKHIRIKWWLNPENKTYKDLSVEPIAILPEEKVRFKNQEEVRYYNEYDKPVFFGHYWLKGSPIQFAQNVCCVDFSVAKGGYLVAYCFDGEKQLSSDKLVYV